MSSDLTKKSVFPLAASNMCLLGKIQHCVCVCVRACVRVCVRACVRDDPLGGLYHVQRKQCTQSKGSDRSKR